MLVSAKPLTLLKLIFIVIEMQQIATFGIIQKVLFLFFYPSISLTLIVGETTYVCIYEKILNFFF